MEKVYVTQWRKRGEDWQPTHIILRENGMRAFPQQRSNLRDDACSHCGNALRGVPYVVCGPEPANDEVLSEHDQRYCLNCLEYCPIPVEFMTVPSRETEESAAEIEALETILRTLKDPESTKAKLVVKWLNHQIHRYDERTVAEAARAFAVSDLGVDPGQVDAIQLEVVPTEFQDLHRINMILPGSTSQRSLMARRIDAADEELPRWGFLPLPEPLQGLF